MCRDLRGMLIVLGKGDVVQDSICLGGSFECAFDLNTIFLIHLTTS